MDIVAISAVMVLFVLIAFVPYDKYLTALAVKIGEFFFNRHKP